MNPCVEIKLELPDLTKKNIESQDKFEFHINSK